MAERALLSGLMHRGRDAAALVGFRRGEPLRFQRPGHTGAGLAQCLRGGARHGAMCCIPPIRWNSPRCCLAPGMPASARWCLRTCRPARWRSWVFPSTAWRGCRAVLCRRAVRKGLAVAGSRAAIAGDVHFRQHRSSACHSRRHCGSSTRNWPAWLQRWISARPWRGYWARSPISTCTASCSGCCCRWSPGDRWETLRLTQVHDLARLPAPEGCVLVSSPAQLARLPSGAEVRFAHPRAAVGGRSAGRGCGARLPGRTGCGADGDLRQLRNRRGGVAVAHVAEGAGPWKALPGVEFRAVEGLLQIRSAQLPDLQWFHSADRVVMSDGRLRTRRPQRSHREARGETCVAGCPGKSVAGFRACWRRLAHW